MSYDASEGGFKRLAELDEAEHCEDTARDLRSAANLHSTEHEWVQKNYVTAQELEQKAKALRNR